MKTKRKLLCLLMAFAMFLTLLPATSAFANGQNPSLEVMKSADKTEFSAIGEKITYIYTVKNTGNVTISAPFIFEDDKIGVIDTSSAPNNLEPGKDFTVTATYLVSQDDIDEGHIKNWVVVKGDYLEQTGSIKQVPARAETTIHYGPSLKIEKSASKQKFSTLDELIIYTYKVTNIGKAETIYGSADGPAPGPFILNDDQIGAISSEGIVSLEPNESFTLTAEYTVTQANMDAGFVTNKVSVEGSYLDFPNNPIQAATELTIPAKEPVYPGNGDGEKPSLKLKKSANKAEFSQAGEIITYTYVITNTGNVEVRGDFYGAEEESFKLVDDKIGDIDTSSKPSQLDPGESFTVKAEYKVVQADMNAKKVTNIAKIKGVSGNNYLEDTDTVTVTAKKKSKPGDSAIGDKLNIEDHFQYIGGYPDKTVRPEGLITREEVASVFYRLLTSDYRDSIRTKNHSFKDVQAGRWSEQSIATLTNAKIIVGYEDGSFRPGKTITRAELAAIASRFDNLTPFTSDKFSDIKNHWANGVINSAAQKGWVNGYEDGIYKPNQSITRAEFVALVNNVLNRRVKKADILPEAKQFPDLMKNKWYYATMQEAINSHHYTREKNTDYEVWLDIY